MDIISLSQLSFSKAKQEFNLFIPQFFYLKSDLLGEYVVQKGEEMRIDLVIMSIYDDTRYLEEVDVLLFINNIDNPLNVNVGDVIYYPPAESLSSYRFIIDTASKGGADVRNILSVPNKTMKKDPNRKKFVDNGYVLPPVVLDEAKSPVRLEDGNIVIGGLN